MPRVGRGCPRTATRRDEPAGGASGPRAPPARRRRRCHRARLSAASSESTARARRRLPVRGCSRLARPRRSTRGPRMHPPPVRSGHCAPTRFERREGLATSGWKASSGRAADAAPIPVVKTVCSLAGSCKGEMSRWGAHPTSFDPG